MAGFDVRTAFTGPAGQAAAPVCLPEVVLLDIGLPELNGYEVARRLRQDPRLKGVWLVAVTGYGADANLRLAQEARFDRYLVKPLDFPAVEELLTTLLTPPSSPDRGLTDASFRIEAVPDNAPVLVRPLIRIGADRC